MSDTAIEFEIVKKIGVIGEARGGWKKEVNMVSWNKREPKVDIRDWDPEHKKMGKGITLTKEEAERLVALLKQDLEQA